MVLIGIGTNEAEELARLAYESGMHVTSEAIRRAIGKSNEDRYSLKTECPRKREPDQAEPNGIVVKEFKFDIDDIADFVGKYGCPIFDIQLVIGDAVRRMMRCMPDFVVDLIADDYAKKEDFKHFIAERKGN